MCLSANSFRAIANFVKKYCRCESEGRGFGVYIKLLARGAANPRALADGSKRACIPRI